MNESFARDLEARGRARVTVTRRLCTIAGFYRYAVEEELLEHSPAVHFRRPRADYESRAVALDRNELGAILVAAGLGPPAEHALICLLALNGLRVCEATGARLEQFCPRRVTGEYRSDRGNGVLSGGRDRRSQGRDRSTPVLWGPAGAVVEVVVTAGGRRAVYEVGRGVRL